MIKVNGTLIIYVSRRTSNNMKHTTAYFILLKSTLRSKNV